MARAKKEAALTPEERLQAALVPDWERPYKLPENWCWTKIGSISSLHRGVSYKKTDAHTERRENSCLVMRGGNICEGSIDTEADNIYVDISLVAENQIVRKNDIIIVASTGSTKVIGRAGISKMDYLDVAFGAFLLLVRPSTKVNQRYIDYFFLSDNYRNRIKKLASGININNIRGEYITETLVPLAPLAEQQRIVDRIESLFSKLDEAKEKAQAVVDSFETRKAAILHKAFTGELTAKWREEHDVGMESWETRELAECFEIVSGIQKTPARSPKDNPVPYLTVANVYRGRIDLSDIRYFEVTSKEIEKLKLQDKDILIVEGNGSGNEIGRCAIWHNELPLCIHQNHIIRMRRKTADILPEYALHYLNSEAGKSIMRERSKTTAGLFNLSAGKIKTIPLPMASLDEQSEIIHLIDSLLEKEQQTKEAAEAVLDQIDLMKKSILARAFRGELGTNDPREESAVELLKQLI